MSTLHHVLEESLAQFVRGDHDRRSWSDLDHARQVPPPQSAHHSLLLDYAPHVTHQRGVDRPRARIPSSSVGRHPSRLDDVEGRGRHRRDRSRDHPPNERLEDHDAGGRPVASLSMISCSPRSEYRRLGDAGSYGLEDREVQRAEWHVPEYHRHESPV